LEERLLALELQEKTLQEDYGADYPALRSLGKQIAMLRTQMGRLGKAGDNEETGRLDMVKTHIQSLKLEADNAHMAAEALSKLLEEEQRKAKNQRAFEQQGESYRLDIARSQQLFDAIAKRVDEVSILKNFVGGYEADTIAPPQVGRKVYPQPLLVFTAAAILGLLAGIGLAYLTELSDQSFRTPEEIRRRLGLPIVGHIPFFASKEVEKQLAGAAGSPLDPILCTVFHTKSRESESYRGVRTALFFSNRGEGHKVIQLTSPDMGDGKTTLAANLAVSIAQAEKKVIVIDADFRRPRLHKLFGVSGKQGLASVITGEAELDDVIQPTAIPGLFVLPCGPTPPNPAELLTLPRLPEVLASLRERYDFVVVDTPPLLAVTDPCVVVPLVDGVILTVRISKNARPHALRAKEILATLGAKVIGVVVNGVGRDAKGYGYDNYRYGYTYRYEDYSNRDQNDPYYSSEADGEGGAQTGEEAPAGQGSPGSAQPFHSRKRKGFLARLFNR
jgi:capsular exopolysaccharide synthesis family protein